MSAPLSTEFASPGRASRQVVVAQYQTFVGTHCREFFDALPSVILVLNQQRQVVFANRAAVGFLGAREVDEVLGLRPGEALECVNARVNAAGCGTSRHCRNCEAVRAILAAVEGAAGNGLCTLLRRDEQQLEGLDLQVHTSPLIINGEGFVVFSATDATHEMRRRSMERIFFHDVLNLAGGISGLVDLLNEDKVEDPAEKLAVLQVATTSLVDEIVAQRELLAAETRELKARFAPVGTRLILRQALGLYSGSPFSRGQELRVLESSPDLVLETDARLVQRVLGNMLKNALEAGEEGDSVVLACEDLGEEVRLLVRSRAVIPAEIQENIFRRRFSTKGDSRGLGTYSMLLLSERYLHGRMDFTSTEAEGTTFSLLLPKRIEKA